MERDEQAEYTDYATAEADLFRMERDEQGVWRNYAYTRAY
eukprot:CAMPEP_0171293692 /NCGR_PEP_ID=MMETSP0816-20121228/2023_1 /TAXON_ID=420281 /ORGANISM="Proboscia inermis, Strain CCAP1064/1" /LENGTH=39 /DNA_ID= /DNA_START= /DNA_END= /DNA_ORIENTATION=